MRNLRITVFVAAVWAFCIALAAAQTYPQTHRKAVVRVRQLGAVVHTGDAGHTTVVFTPFGADHLAPLQHVQNLTVLDLSGHRVIDSHVVHLVPLQTLTELRLSNTLVTDVALIDLCNGTRATATTPAYSGLVNLEVLDLGGTGVTDAGLVHLAKLVKLKRLNLKKTKVTRAGIVRLQRALPGTVIDY